MPPDRFSIPPQIMDEASGWFVLMREPSVLVEDQEAFAQWLRASPVHVGAYLEIARLWGDAAHLGPDINLAAGQHSNILPLTVPGVRRFRDPELKERLDVRKRRIPTPTAVAFVCCALACATWWYLDWASGTYTSGVGEQRAITLEDGSTVRLDSHSSLRVRFTPEARQIELSDGQALFDVAHDATRPFIVKSGSIVIRAIGTRFDVNRSRSDTVVTVVEGRVRVNTAAPSGLAWFFSEAALTGQGRRPVDPTGGAAAGNDSRGGSADIPRARADITGGMPKSATPPDGAGAILLSAGEQVRVAGVGGLEQPIPANTVAATSWTQQELIFDGQSLAEVIEAFNRYTRVPIVLSDPSLADLRINAVFHTTSPDSLLKFLLRFDGIHVEQSAKEIRIYRK